MRRAGSEREKAAWWGRWGEETEAKNKKLMGHYKVISLARQSQRQRGEK